MTTNLTDKNSFIFYRSFFEATIPLSDEEKLSLFNAICEYGLNQTETELKPIAKAMFSLIKPQLMANQKRYENGNKGGRPRNQTETEKEPNTNLDETKPEPNKNVNDNVNVNKNDNKLSKGKKLNAFLDSLEEMKNLDYKVSVPDAFFELAEQKNILPDEVYKQWEKFYFYYNSPDCKKPFKRDWLGAWRNWITK